MTEKQLQKFYSMAEPRSENALKKAEERKKKREQMPMHEDVLPKLDKYDEYMDKECISLCDKLNSLEYVETTESCCGHYRNPYMIFFNCFSFNVLGRLYRCVDKNYSDGKWRIECCCGDTSPCYGFLLRTHEPFKTETEMVESINGLIENIDYWMDKKWDDYFI